MAFRNCTSLASIDIPSTVKRIGPRAFHGCTRLSKVQLHEGLESIVSGSFLLCASLESISIPSTVKTIDNHLFAECAHLHHVELHEGLERILNGAFYGCSALERISIPSTVKRIHRYAFDGCTSLAEVEFSNEISHFVREASLGDWWNHGIPEKSIEVFNLLVRHRIPERLGMIHLRQWHVNIYDLFKCIPSIELIEHPKIEWLRDERTTSCSLARHFVDIDSTLADYEMLKQEVPPVLMRYIATEMIQHILSFL